jgi:transposase
MRIRAAGRDEIEAVLALWRAAGSAPAVNENVEGLRALLARDPESLPVAEEDGELVGTLVAAGVGWFWLRGGLGPDSRACASSAAASQNVWRPLKMFDRKCGGTFGAGVESGRIRPEEVLMRPPEVFVRELAPAEGQRLKRLSKQSKLASTRQRAMILLASNTLMSAPEISRMLLTDESQVRKVIHDFNRHGFESLRPRFRGGRPRRISIDDEQRIVAVAGARPDTLGVPYTRWSLAKLSRYLRGQDIEVSPAQLGRILARNGISLQRTRSWKQSPDPDYEAKAPQILALYREKPRNGVVISFDEKGPESLCPKHGRGWARRGRPERHRATFNRRQGIRYLVGALDVHADYLRIGRGRAATAPPRSRS